MQNNKERQMQDHLEQNKDADAGARVAVSTLDDSGEFGMRVKKAGGGQTKGWGKSGTTRLNLQFNSPQ